MNVKVPLFKEIQGESNHGYLYSFVDYDYKHLIMLDDIKNEIILFEEKTNDESDNFYILDDTFYINTIGDYHSYRLLAEENWQIGTELPVFYNSKNSIFAYYL